MGQDGRKRGLRGAKISQDSGKGRENDRRVQQDGSNNDNGVVITNVTKMARARMMPITTVSNKDHGPNRRNNNNYNINSDNNRLQNGRPGDDRTPHPSLP